MPASRLPGAVVAAAVVMAAGLGCGRAQTSRLPLVPDVPPVDTRPPPSPPVQPAQGPCQATVFEEDGVVTLQFTDTSRSDQRLEYTIGELRLAARFDASGLVRAQGPLLQESSSITWMDARGMRCSRQVAFRNFASTALTALVWDGAAELALHVVEPAGRRVIVAPKASQQQSVAGRSPGAVFGEPGGAGSHAVVYTVLPDRRSTALTYYLRVEFASRGNPARQPFCSGSPLATVPYRLVQLSAGKAQSRSEEFGSVPCGQGWATAEDAFSPPRRWVP